MSVAQIIRDSGMGYLRKLDACHVPYLVKNGSVFKQSCCNTCLEVSRKFRQKPTVVFGEGIKYKGITVPCVYFPNKCICSKFIFCIYLGICIKRLLDNQ